MARSWRLRNRLPKGSPYGTDHCVEHIRRDRTAPRSTRQEVSVKRREFLAEEHALLLHAAGAPSKPHVRRTVSALGEERDDHQVISKPIAAIRGDDKSQSR